MKIAFAFAVLSLTSLTAFAEESFPGLKQLLSDAEWKRAGLDRLSPDQVGVIDAALIRYQGRTATQHQEELAQVRAAQPAPTSAIAHKPGMLERFGLPTFDEPDWRDVPPLRATVVSWVSANRFKLDNGQVWEGFDSIPYELVGKPIEISARPHGQFALTVDGKATTVRIMRLR